MNTVRMGFQFVFSSTIYLACCLDLSEGYSSIFCSNDRKYRLLLADGIFVSTGSHSKMPQIVWLKQRKFISHSYGSWLVQNLGASRFWFLLKVFFPACRWPPSCHVLT